MVEGSQVFGRAATTGDDDHLNILDAIEILNAVTDVSRSTLSLHLCGINQNTGAVMAAPQNVEDVAQRGGLRRRDNSDAAWQCRNRFFAGRVKKTFRLELGLKLFECDLQRARAFGLQVFS